MKKNNIIVTGGSGFIGSCLVKNLSKKNKIIILDKKEPSSVSNFNKNVNFYKLDLNSKERLFKIISRVNPNIIIHLAAQSTIDMVKKKRKFYIRDNVDSTINIVNACNKFNIEKLIFSSSAAVYKKGQNKLKENSLIFSNNIYGKTKIYNEKYLKKKLAKSKCGILRFFNVCSSDRKNKVGELHNPETHLIPLIVNKIKQNEIIKVYGNTYSTYDGTCIRDYVHIKDVVDGINKLIEYLNKQKYGIFNLGSGDGFSILEIIKECEKRLKSKAKIIFAKKRFGDSDRLVCNINKAKTKLKWKPKRSKLKNIIDDEIWWNIYLKKKKIKRKFIY